MKDEALYDKIYGCWLGKNIGGALGGPLEGQRNPKPLPFEFPDLNAPNDDLDLQLVWLDLLNKKGVKISAEDFMPCWVTNIVYPWDEYASAAVNIRRGLKPPLTGYFNNPFYECMGSPIRSEIWACVCAGAPDAAAWYAWQDAQLDHYDEGVYGEVFFAAMESLAFVENDIETIVRRAGKYLPESSEIKRAVDTVFQARRAGTPLAELREELVRRYDRGNVTHCLINIAFTAAGLLYGDMDFLRSMVLGINLGYDTDCVGATIGAIIGIMMGKKAILERYKVTFDDKIIVGWGVTGIDPPKNLDELTVQTLALHKRLLESPETPKLPKPFELPRLPADPIALPREFWVSSRFGSFDEAIAALRDSARGFEKVSNPYSDIVDLTGFKRDGKPIYVATRIKLPEGKEVSKLTRIKAPFLAEVSVFGTDALNFWINGEFAQRHERGENARVVSGEAFTPCPVRAPRNVRHQIFDGAEIVVEIFPEAKRNLLAIMVSDTKIDYVADVEYIAK